MPPVILILTDMMCSENTRCIGFSNDMAKFVSIGTDMSFYLKNKKNLFLNTCTGRKAMGLQVS